MRFAHGILTVDMADQNYWQQEPSEQEEPTPLDVAQSRPQTLSEEDTPDNPPITWSAQEYVHLDKGPWWYVLFGLVVLGFIALDVFVLRSWTLSLLVVVMAVAVMVYIRRPPRTLTYALSPKQGLYIGEQLYEFDQFKSFGLIQDGESHSIMLIPRKRFSPGVSVYFPEDAGERIVDILGQRLPMETLKLDVVDVIVRKLRL
jgi:hypothetical protein